MNTLSKNATLLEFLHTSVSLGERDGEVDVECVVKLQLGKLDIDGFYKEYQKKYPFISKTGVFVTKGKAICGNEKFDFEKGKNIAETRAQAKAYDIAGNVYEMIIQYLVNTVNAIYNVVENNDRCYANCQVHIEELDS